MPIFEDVSKQPEQLLKIANTHGGVLTWFYLLSKGWDKDEVKCAIRELEEQGYEFHFNSQKGYLMLKSPQSERMTDSRVDLLKVIANQLQQELDEERIEYTVKDLGRINGVWVKELFINPELLPRAGKYVYDTYQLIDANHVSCCILLTMLESKLLKTLLKTDGYIDRRIWEEAGMDPTIASLHLAIKGLVNKLKATNLFAPNLLKHDRAGYSISKGQRLEYLDKVSQESKTNFTLDCVSIQYVDPKEVRTLRLGGRGQFYFVTIQIFERCWRFEIPSTELEILLMFMRQNSYVIFSRDLYNLHTNDKRYLRRFNTNYLRLISRLRSEGIPTLPDDLQRYKQLTHKGIYRFPIISKSSLEG